MKEITGNLITMALNGGFDVISHGANCFNVMGAGIAKQIKENFPEAYEADLKTIKGSKLKLGTLSTAKHNDLIIINAYTQYYPGRNFDYNAIELCFNNIAAYLDNLDNLRIFSLGIPKIGCGIAGGDWNIVKDIVKKTLDKSNIEVTVVNLPEI